MNDLISRQAAIDAIRELESGEDFNFNNGLICAMNNIDALPSAQSEPAQWVKMLINPNLYKCSNCQVAWNKRFVFDNEGYSENIFMKYCPCCGRKMKAKIDYE